jgi:hypothetical protein
MAVKGQCVVCGHEMWMRQSADASTEHVCHECAGWAGRILVMFVYQLRAVTC